MTSTPRRGSVRFVFAALCALASAAHAATPAISAGAFHSVGLNIDGVVRTWGEDSSGQLGIGRQLQYASPMESSGISGARAISAGANHTVALRTDGSVWAWGDNPFGQLGDGTTTSRSTPVQVSGLAGVVAISAGSTHTVAVKSDGSVWAWGQNQGLLGDGTTANHSIPVQVSGLTGVMAVSAGRVHTVALKGDGSVWAWGANFSGQLGGSTTSGSALVQASGLTGVVAISAGGDQSVALKGDGSVWAWGWNAYGQLGDGTTTNRSTPVKLIGLTGVTAISAGEYHTVALKGDGSVWAWGGNFNGQLGDGTRTNRSSPVQVRGLTNSLGLTDVVAISAGYGHTAAIRSGGFVWAWGYNFYGQLGDGSTVDQSIPVQISGLTGVVSISAGGDAFSGHTVALKGDGSAWAWGSNSHGQVGDGKPTSRVTPVQVSALASVVAISAGSFHTVALKGDGSVWAWGDNLYGQLGDGTNTDRSSPVQVSGLTGVVAISAGGFHTVALKGDGSVWAWGWNFDGQLGDGTTFNSRSAPVLVSGLIGATAISAGENHTLALRPDGSVWAWGNNGSGQLGDGTTTSRSTPVQVRGLTGVVAISTGLFSREGGFVSPALGHSVALKADGSVWAWGNNGSGQLGDGTTTNRPTPVNVIGLSGAVAISAGWHHTVALTSGGNVWAWGITSGGTGDFRTPARVSGLTSVAAISAGGSHTVALKSDGTVLTWGWNRDGQLGDGTLADRYVPVVVVRDGGAGKIETNDWFLDLNLAIPKTIPDDKIPSFLAVASQSGADISANIQYGASDVGKVGSVYVYALAPATLVKDAVVAEKHLGPVTNATAKDAPIACVLAQLNASGQLTAAAANALKAQLTGTFGQSQTVEMLKGIPPANVQGAVFNIGYGSSSAEMSRRGTNRSVATVSADQTCQPQAPQTGWWWNPNEGGRGFSIEARGNKLFMAGYFYDVSGRATWMTSGGYTALDGSLYNEGTLLNYANGQTLTGSYKQPSAPTAGGTITFSFSDARHGTMFWPGGTVAIERADTLLGGATTQPAFVPESGWWWNASESGRGYFMEFKNSFAFMAGYMYDASGNPLWYLASGNMPSQQVFQTNWTQYANGQTMTGAYKPATMINGNVGALTIQFQDTANAMLTLPNGTQLPITRFKF